MIFRKKINLLLIIAALVVVGYGCRGPREMIPDVRPLSTADLTLIEIHSHQADFEWFSTRFSGTVVWEDRRHSIAGTMRIRKDSAIYVSVAPILGIEVARALITPDSVRVISRMESTYYYGDLGALSKMFNADVDFYMLQALILGNDFPHFRTDQFLLKDDPRLLRLEAPSRYRKSGVGNPIQQVLTVDPTNMRIRTNIMEHTHSGNALRADYRRYESVGGILLPAELNLIFADQGNSSNLEMTFSRSSLNVPQRMDFSVPSRYVPVRLTD